MLYTQSVKNIVSGISQQPDLLKMPEQLAEQVNGFSTEVSGLQKRPPTLLINSLFDTVTADKDAKVHWVDRDANERYCIILTSGDIKVFDLAGIQKSVTIPAAYRAYITTDNPRRDLKVITVADYTFIVNKNYVPSMQTDLSPSLSSQGGLVVVKNGQYGRKYQVYINNTLAGEISTPNGATSTDILQIDTTTIATNLRNALAAGSFSSSFNFTVQSNWIHITPKSTVALNSVECQDGFGNTALIGFSTSIQRFNLLPATAPDGYTVEIKGDPATGVKGHWVSYSTAETVWKEVIAPSTPYIIEPTAMPHQLVRNANGTFTFGLIDWDNRKAGDVDSNPDPSFIGHSINDIFFYRNRLGLLAGENVILSESGNFFNFWFASANDVLDTDTIDLPTTTTRINTLLYAVPWDESLYLFSDSTQFILSSDSTLTPKSAVILEVTGFNSHPDCRPTVAGRNIYFAAERSEYASIKEYYNVQQVSDVKNAQDITAHVPEYIPNGVHSIIANTSENIMMVQTTGDRGSLYVYKYLFMNENRVQSSWSRWQFTGKIVGAGFFGSELYLLTIHGGNKMQLEKMLLTYNTKDYSAEPYRIYMDRKVRLSGVTYDADYNTSTINVGAELGVDANKVAAPTVGLVTADGQYYSELVANVKANGWKLPVDLRNTVCFIGIPYMFQAVIAPLYIKKADNNGGFKALTNGRLQVRAVRVNYADTGYFSITVTNKASLKARTYVMSSRVLGTRSAMMGEEPSGTGIFRAPVQLLNTMARISIESDQPLPLSLIGYQWEGNYVARNKEV